MKKYFTLIVLALKAFFMGARIGLDWYYQVLFAYKLPRWLAWSFGLLTVPFNLIVMLVALVINQYGWVRKHVEELMAEVDLNNL